MKNLFIFIAFFSSFFISLHQCGHIYSQSSEILPQNAQSAIQFNFFFMVETQLAMGDCLFIKFPFLVQTATAAVYSSLDTTVWAVPTATTTAYAANGVTPSTSIDTRYYSLNAALSSGQWYRAQINITTAAASANQAVGVAGCVWFATTSTWLNNYITYDENRCFDVLSFAPPIDTTSGLFVVTGYTLYASSGTYTAFGGSYGVNFDITPSKNVDLPGAVFTITLPPVTSPNLGFTFSGSCSSIACLNNDGTAGDYCISTNLTALPSTGYTCAVSSNVLTLTMTQAVNSSITTRIQATVQAPLQYVESHIPPTAVFKSAKAPIIFATTNVAVGTMNGINLVTAFTTITTVSGTVKLMWGVVPSSAGSTFTTRLSGFAGCPISLFASGANIKVYNSMQTSFTLTTAITAMQQDTYIKALWTISVASSALIDSVIINSLYTTMPGTYTIDTSAANGASSVITFKGLSSLSASTYIIGGKFSLSVTNAYVALSTLASPSSPTCGAVSIQSGDGAVTYYSISGTTIGVRTNMEYHDTGIANAGDGAFKLYNQLFSYYVDDTTNYNWGTLAAPTTTSLAQALFQSKFLGMTGTNNAAGTVSATAAVWPKIGSSGTQALLLQLSFVEGAVCATTGTVYGVTLTSTTSCSSGSSTYTPLLASMLTIVFNNGILGISSSNFYNGAKVIGTIFPGAAGTASSVFDYDSTRNTASGNMISFESTPNFWHLNIMCKGGAGKTLVDACFTSPAYSTTSGALAFSAISFIGTSITKYPTLYADSYVLDFIVCLKVNSYEDSALSISTGMPLETTTSKWYLVEEGCSALSSSGTCTIAAGPGLINGYVISGLVDYNTVKTSVVNGYVGATSVSGIADTIVKPFFPAYLRLGMTISAPVVATNTVGFFIGGTSVSSSYTVFNGLSTYADTTGTINIMDTVNSVSTAIVGQGALVEDKTLTDHWWAQNCLIMSSTVSTSGTTFNFYVPIQSSFKSIDSLNVVFLGSKTSGTYPVNAVYRVYGGIVSNTVISSSPTFIQVGVTYYHSVGTVADAQLAYTGILTSSSGVLAVTTVLWDNGLIGSGGTTGCFGSTTATTVPTINGVSVLPSKTMTSSNTIFTISTDVQAPSGNKCNVNTGNTGASAQSGNARTALTGWGTAFIVYVREASNILASTSNTWTFASSKTNACLPQTIIYQTANIYTLFCTADQPSGNGLTFGTGGTITYTSFTVPFWWGKSYVISNKLQYMWSSKAGAWTSLNGDPSTTSSWAYSSLCTVTDISVIPSSYDVPYTLTLTSTSGVSYNLNKGDTLNLALSTSTSTLTYYGACSHSTLGCSMSSGTSSSIVLTAKAAVAVASSSIVVTGWLDTQATSATLSVVTVLITYTASGGSTSGTIETCTSKSSEGWTTTGTAAPNLVSISSWSYMANQNARGVWSFSFGYPGIVRNGYDFSLMVGPLAVPTTGNNNYRCMILSNGQVSNSFSTITPFDGSYNTIVTSKALFQVGTGFTYKCIGGSAPDWSVTNTVSGALQRTVGTSISGTPTTALTITTTPTTSAGALSSISLTKVWNARGFDSDYVFSFLPGAANITLSGRIVVEFSQSIAPKFNRYGKVQCYLNETPTYCEYPTNDERRVLVWPTIPLMTTSAYQYTVRIAGITQPNSLGGDADTNLKIFFALSATSDPYQGITEYAYVTEAFDVSTTSMASILIQDFSFSPNKFRSSSATFTYLLNIPQSTFTTASILWLQFPGSLDQAFFYGASPSITLFRIYDSTNTNLVAGISLMRGRRVAVSLKADASNAVIACNYTLTISGIPTPMNPSAVGYMREDFRIWTSADNITVASSTTSGARNTTNYISWNVGTYTTSQILLWYNKNFNQLTGPVDVSIGTYQCLVFLSASQNNFINTFNFSISGGNQTAFNAVPQDPTHPIRGAIGNPSAPVYIAANTGTLQGIYYLKWSSTDTQDFTIVPNLDIRVVSSNCTPTLSAASFDVPLGGGTSDPIIIDFSQCIPVSDVTVTANISFGYNMSSAAGISFTGQQTQSSSLTFTDMSGNYKVAFYAISNTISGINGTAAPGAGTITLAMSGTNGANINSPGTVNINLVQGSTTAPNPQTPTMTNSVLGVGCDLKGTNFFALATYNNAAQYSLSYINNITQVVKVTLTSPAPNDPNYSVFGYVAGLTPPALSQVNLAGRLKAGGNLTVYSYCYSNSMIPSLNASSLNWLQPDNSGATVVLQATFNAPVSSAQKLELACSLVKALVIPSRLVLTDDNHWCTSLRVLQSNSSSNTSTNTTTTTTNTSTTNSSTAKIQTYTTFLYVLKNFLATTDNTSALLIAQITSPTFLSSLISSTGDTSFPTPASNLFTSTIISYSNNGTIVIPVVTYVSSVTNTGSINATFNLSNMNGIIYAGCEPNVVNQTATPNASQLMQGFNGNNVQLFAFGYVVATMGIPSTINLTGLTNSTQYIVYYVANNMDISVNGLFSAVVNTTLSTNTPGSSFGSALTISMMALVLVLFALFGMI